MEQKPPLPPVTLKTAKTKVQVKFQYEYHNDVLIEESQRKFADGLPETLGSTYEDV